MASWKWFGKAHAALYRLSAGRIGARLGGIDMVLVETVGRKTGIVRWLPIACYPYGDSVLVVASNNGLPKDPLWCLNIRAAERVQVRLGRDLYWAKARELQGEEREAAWPDIIKINPRQKHYAKVAGRVLPVIFLERI